MSRVAVTCTHLQRDIELYRDQFSDAGLELVLPEIPGQELAGDELVSAMQGLVGVIAGDDQFDQSVLQQLPEMKVISKWGIGLDGIDLPAAADLGITVTNTPGMFGNEVAEQALGYLIALVRGLVKVDKSVRNGGWPKPVGRSLNSLSAGVIGLGNIGQSLVDKLIALGLDVAGSDPSVEAKAWAAKRGIETATPQQLVVGRDVLLITCPLNEHTLGMVNADLIAGMPRGSWLVNVGRGPVAVGADIADAIESGHLAGVALDVYEEEPLIDERLRHLPNCILGSHNASNTNEACHRTHQQAIENLLKGLPQ